MLAAEVFFAYYGVGKGIMRFMWKGPMMCRGIRVVLILCVLVGLLAPILQGQGAADAGADNINSWR